MRSRERRLRFTRSTGFTRRLCERLALHSPCSRLLRGSSASLLPLPPLCGGRAERPREVWEHDCERAQMSGRAGRTPLCRSATSPPAERGERGTRCATSLYVERGERILGTVGTGRMRSGRLGAKKNAGARNKERGITSSRHPLRGCRRLGCVQDRLRRGGGGIACVARG